VVTCSARENSGLDTIWSHVLAHRAKFKECTLVDQRRRSQAKRWMWELVDEHIQRLLNESSGMQNLAARLESEVQAGRITSAAAAERIIQALGLKTT
jgi:LAO/AO transport system kinase